ncbi:unnamed protein product [Clonostachys rosea]|uniref:Uncharacterized protein n=1 Tax=Bionectria ochroleuca TaxID=29856 RepID=A0ABY6V318_BIOOC|nr:unnamed protein product [Clonostachys rosea]
MDFFIQIQGCVDLEGQDRKYREGAFSNDSALIAFTDDDGSASYVGVWRTATGNCIRRFDSWKRTWDSLKFSQDSNLIAAIGGGIICTWDITSGQCRQQTTLETYTHANHPSVIFSPNLDWAMGINLGNKIRPSSGRIHVLDFQTGIEMVRVKNLYPHHAALSFQSQSSLLLVGTGAIELMNFPSSLSERLHESVKHRRSGYGISLDYCWITWDDDNFFYLRPNYQPNQYDTILISEPIIMISYTKLAKTVIFKFSSAKGSKPVADTFIDHSDPVPSRP